MHFSTSILVASIVLPNALAAPITLAVPLNWAAFRRIRSGAHTATTNTTNTTNNTATNTTIGDKYIIRTGDGSSWPDMNQWYPQFEDM
jgi:hypothetical protein